MNLQPGGHLDQMLRQTRWHHATLSSMADVKASMMLTVSSVVLTLAVRYLTEPRLKWSAATLMAFCLGTIVLSAWAAMPKLPFRRRRGAPPDPGAHGFNLLFFGDFVRLSYVQFESAMEEVMSDPGKTYAAQVREIYLLGIFLATKKYRFVRLSYACFIAGLLASGIVLVAGK
jgi:pycsar effector protein